MNKVERFPRASLGTLLVALALGAGCRSESSGGTQTDTETNWLTLCTDDGECGDYSCECGVCTLPCETDTECPMAGAVCSQAGESDHDAVCREATHHDGLCLDPNQDTGEGDDAPGVTGDDDASGAAGAPSTPEPAEPPEPPQAPEPPPPPVDVQDSGIPDPGPTAVPGELPGAEMDASVAPVDGGTSPAPSSEGGPEADPCPAGDAMADCEPGPELVQGYVLWDRPGGVAGTGPALELLEDGTFRLWSNVEALAPRQTSEWDFETTLEPAQVDAIVRLLLAVDYDGLPHEVDFLECYPGLYFEGPDGELVDLDYGGAAALLPEMQAVYDWFDTLLTEVAPDQLGPADYCPNP